MSLIIVGFFWIAIACLIVIWCVALLGKRNFDPHYGYLATAMTFIGIGFVLAGIIEQIF